MATVDVSEFADVTEKDMQAVILETTPDKMVEFIDQNFGEPIPEEIRASLLSLFQKFAEMLVSNRDNAAAMEREACAEIVEDGEGLPWKAIAAVIRDRSKS